MTNIESLGQWDVEIGRLTEMRASLRGRPEYPLAARTLAANMLRDADRDPALGGMLRDAGRTVAALSAISLHLTGGVTLARLKTFIAGFGLVSPGRARALLSYMLYLGYLEQEPVGSSPRRTTYRATSHFLASYVQHEASLLAAVQVVEPAVELVLKHLADPQVLKSLVLAQGKAFAEGSRQTPAFEAWYRTFMHRLGGIQILHGLTAAAQEFPPHGTIPFSAAEAARRFKVSRIHVNRILNAGAVHGFLELEPGGVRFTASGREALDWLYASRLSVHLACAAQALKAIPQPGCGGAA